MLAKTKIAAKASTTLTLTPMYTWNPVPRYNFADRHPAYLGNLTYSPKAYTYIKDQGLRG